MKTKLDEILERRRADLQAEWIRFDESRLETLAARRVPRSLRAALRSARAPRIVAEMKRRSPSAGRLIEDYQPAKIAAEYERAGAVALSVLTEPGFFGGSGGDLEAARAATHLPVLCKDFLFDPRQVLQAAAWGADAVLLIAAALTPPDCLELYRRALDLGLDVVVEMHGADEWETAIPCSEAILGINHRDLRTLETRLDLSRILRPRIPPDRLTLAESGLRSGAQLRDLERLGYDGFLIGESLLRGGMPGVALERLIRETEAAG